jgi:hypothetical protein
MVQDDGDICIYKGTGPSDNQGLVWQTATNGKAQDGDPSMTATTGKNGRNYLKTGETLQIGEFIGNTNGTVYLVMQQDGNLVAYTSQTSSSCSKSSANNNQTVASGGDYAIYKLPAKGNAGNLGKMAHIDNNGTLLEYPVSMLSNNSKKFTVIKNADSPGNDIGSPITGVSMGDIETFASETNGCVGFVYDKNSNIGYLKSKIAATNSLELSHTRDIYLMIPSIAALPTGVNPNIHEIDSVLYEHYPKGAQMTQDYKPSLIIMNEVQKAQLGQLYDSLNLVANQMKTFTDKLKARGVHVSDQIVQNSSFINTGALELDAVNEKIKQNSTRDLEVYNQILNDNQLLAMSQNYNYMIWTIIALGMVIVTVNATR